MLTRCRIVKMKDFPSRRSSPQEFKRLRVFQLDMLALVDCQDLQTEPLERLDKLRLDANADPGRRSDFEFSGRNHHRFFSNESQEVLPDLKKLMTIKEIMKLYFNKNNFTFSTTNLKNFQAETSF